MEQRLFTPWTVGASLGVHLLAVLILALGPLARPRASFTPGRAITIRVAPPLPRSRPASRPSTAPPARPAAPAPAKKLPPPKPPKKESPKPVVAPEPTPDKASTPAALPAGEPAVNGIVGAAVQGASVAGLDAAYFPFDYYVSQMLNRLSSNWFRPGGPAGTACVVRFTVAKSGRILQAEVERSSGEAAFDRAALRAVLSSSPLPPLPFEYNEEKLGVHLKFE